MKDYRITVKVRNNRILKAIEAVGGRAGGKWCEENGLNYIAVNDFIAMKRSPLLRSGELQKDAARLCEVLNCLPEDLWSNEQLYPLETNISELEMSHEQVTALMHQGESVYQLDDTSHERDEHVALAISKLTDREQEVIRMRFEDDMSVMEISEKLNISWQRVSQLLARVLRKLRHPYFTSVLGQHLDGPNSDHFRKVHEDMRKHKHETLK